MYSCVVELEGEEIEFEGHSSLSAFVEARTYLIKCLRKRLRERKFVGYVKYKLRKNLTFYHNEIKAYNKLKGTGICPELLGYGVVLECMVTLPGSETFNMYGYYVETEIFGLDLSQRFPGGEGPFLHPERKLTLLYGEEFSKCFPYPEQVKEQIRTLIRKMCNLGVYHADLHSLNFLMDEKEQVKVIDFEVCNFC